MSLRAPVTADDTDPLLAALGATLLSVRVLATSNRLTLALAQAHGCAETWSHDARAAQRQAADGA